MATKLGDFQAEFHMKHCPYYNASKGTPLRNKLCPNNIVDVDISCFKWCDMGSDVTCGECAHWAGVCAHGQERHKVVGECFFYGRCKSTQRVDCPRFHRREEGDKCWLDKVENAVSAAMGDCYDGNGLHSSKEERENRIRARNRYAAEFSA